MTHLTSIADLPNVPAVYAMYGGQGRRMYAAYVGVAGKLKNRMVQHLVGRDSSVATGTSAAGLNPDFVTEVRYWEHPDFAERHVLEAAELVAFEVLNPALRSRGAVREQARSLYEDTAFIEQVKPLIQGEPSGCLVIPTLQDALERIADLERRIAEIDARLTGSPGGSDQREQLEP